MSTQVTRSVGIVVIDKHPFLDDYLEILGDEGWEPSVSFTNPVTYVTTIIFKKRVKPSGAVA